MWTLVVDDGDVETRTEYSTHMDGILAWREADKRVGKGVFSARLLRPDGTTHVYTEDEGE